MRDTVPHDATLRATARQESRAPSDTAVHAYLDVQAWQLEEIRTALAEADAGDFASDAEVDAEVKAMFRRFNPA